HAPTFCRAGMGAIPESQNPHKVLASYAKDLDIIVFNGHVHTTEVFDVDGVKYLVVGGGGAEQDPVLPGRTHVKVPANYPPDAHVYLSAGHLCSLIGGEVAWTHIWKGFGALAGAYAFAALASRGLAGHRAAPFRSTPAPARQVRRANSLRDAPDR